MKPHPSPLPPDEVAAVAGSPLPGRPAVITAGSPLPPDPAPTTRSRVMGRLTSGSGE